MNLGGGFDALGIVLWTALSYCQLENDIRTAKVIMMLSQVSSVSSVCVVPCRRADDASGVCRRSTGRPKAAASWQNARLPTMPARQHQPWEAATPIAATGNEWEVKTKTQRRLATIMMAMTMRSNALAGEE